MNGGTRAARADPGVGTIVRSGGFLLLCARLTLTGFALHAAGLALIPLLTGLFGIPINGSLGLLLVLTLLFLICSLGLGLLVSTSAIATEPIAKATALQQLPCECPPYPSP